MTLRDLEERKPALEKLLNQRQELIDIYLSNFNSGDIKEENLERFPVWVFTAYLARIKALYSLGADFRELKEAMGNVIAWYCKLGINAYNPQSTGQAYLDHLTVFSLAYLLEVDDKDWDTLVEKWLSFALKDSIIDFIVSARNSGHPVNENLIFRQPYSLLQEVIKAKDTKSSLLTLRKYLGKWYVSFKSASWYNGHNKKGPAYAGYWSFESAAVAKALFLPLGATKLGQYFPYSFFEQPEQLKTTK